MPSDDLSAPPAAESREIAAKSRRRRRNVLAGLLTLLPFLAMLSLWVAMSWRDYETMIPPPAADRGGGRDQAVAGTAPPAADEAYRAGLRLYREESREANEAAIESLKEAVALAPDLASARAALASAYAMRSIRYGFDETWLDEASAEARRALELDPGLAEAHLAQGLIHDGHHRLEEALASYRRALDGAPENHDALHGAAAAAFGVGAWDDAVRLQLRDSGRPLGRATLAIYLYELGLDDAAARLTADVLLRDALDGSLNRYLALRDGRQTRFDVARLRFGRLTEADPTWASAWRAWGETELAAGEPAIARRHFDRALEVAEGPSPAAELGLAGALLALGEESDAAESLASVEASARAAIDRGSDAPVMRHRLAVVAALRGQPAAALTWLARAVEAGHLGSPWDRVHPAFADLRDTPGFQDLMLAMDEERRRQRDVVSATYLPDVFALPPLR